MPRISPQRLATIFVVLAFIGIPNLLFAVPIPIANHSFEEVVIPDSYYTVNLIPGWRGEASWYHIANPTDSQFAGTSDTHSTSPIDGHNAAAVNTYGHILYQTLNLTVQPGYTYTLSALVGHRNNVPFDDGSINLIAGDRFLARSFASPAEGTFSRVTLAYSSPLEGVVLNQQITIELRSAGTIAQAWFDDVHLDVSAALAGTLASVDTAYIPVPADHPDYAAHKDAWPSLIAFDNQSGPLALGAGDATNVPDGGSSLVLLGLPASLLLLASMRVRTRTTGSP